MTGGRNNFAAEFSQEEVRASKTVMGHALTASSLDSPPMQQVVGPQMERILQRTVRRILHHTVGKEPNHDASDDLSFVTSEKQQSVISQPRVLVELVFCWD
jgi:hypothetical protein